jgi:hypothetical protein
MRSFFAASSFLVPRSAAGARQVLRCPRRLLSVRGFALKSLSFV